MKRSFLFCLYLAFACQITAQEIIRDKPYYLQRSRNQKTAAFILLGGGVALGVTGLLVGNKNESSFDDASTGAILGGVGIAAAIGSIPLFVASKRNRQKGTVIETSFYRQTGGLFSCKIPVTMSLIVHL